MELRCKLKANGMAVGHKHKIIERVLKLGVHRRAKEHEQAEEKKTY